MIRWLLPIGWLKPIDGWLKPIVGYSKRYKISTFDKFRLLASWPVLKCYSLGTKKRKGIIGKILLSLYKLCENSCISHKAYAKDGTEVDMVMSFKKDDLAGFVEIFWHNEYLPPFDILDIRNFIDLGANKGRSSLFFFLNSTNIDRALLVEANPNLTKTIRKTLAPFFDNAEILIDNSCVLGKSGQDVSFTIDDDTRNNRITNTFPRPERENNNTTAPH